MRTLSLTLLGTFSATLDGQPLSGLTYAKLRALLAYLAVERGQPHGRAHLAGLLWPDMPERQARHNLSQAIATLRTALGDRSDTSPLLVADTAAIQLAPALAVEVDALRMVDDIRGAVATPGGRAAQPWAAIAVLEQAVTRYGGELLADLSIGDSLPFEDWAARWRARVREQLICALTRLMAHAEWRDDLAAAAGYARRLVELEPFVELAHRDLARLLALGGEPLVALSHMAGLRRLLAQELQAEPEAATLALAQQISDGQLHDLRRIQPPLLRVPAPPEALIGRQAELDQLEFQLCDQGARLVTIVGPPGVGKSSLAYAVARRLRYRFLHGVVAIECAQLDDPRLALMRLAQLLDIAERPGAALGGALLEELSQLEILLILDNCEHLPALADEAHRLLAACPNLAILATSRTPLSLLAEQRLQLAPLGLPDPGTSLEQIGGAAAMQLLLARAQRVVPALALTPATAPALAAICRRLDGLPLALELVAPRLSETTPDQLATQLERPLAYLDHGPRDLPPRQQTLRGALRWSVDMLGPAEQEVLARLGVFVGGWTIPALRAACPGLADVEASVWQLQRASLIQLQQNSAAPRYTALETIRTYALEMLDATGALAEARGLHGRYYVGMLERPETATADLLAEYDNLRAALTWAVECDACAHTLRLGIGLAQIWNCQRSWIQGLSWLEALFARHMPPVPLDRAPAPYPYLQGWMARHAPLLETESDPQLRRLFAIGQALICQALGRYAETQQLLEAALADSALAASRFPMLILAELYTRTHQLGHAYALYQRCLSASELYGDQAGCAEALCGLARTASLRGHAEDAYRWGARALRMYEGLDQQHGVARSLGVLGGILAQRGNPHAAITSICRSFRLCHQLRDSPGRADACEALAPILDELGHAAQAIELLGAAASIRHMTRTHLTSTEQCQIDIIIERCRAQVGQPAFEQLWHAAQHTTSAEQLALVERVAARRGLS